jgi:hypothetical protein
MIKKDRGMRPIDGDRLKAILNDTEKTLKGIKKDNQEAWDLYIDAISNAFAIIRNVIDLMPTLEIRGEDK